MTTTAQRRRRIFLMRHGSVTYFDLQGKPFEPTSVPLNLQGEAQASAAGRVFAEQKIHFDRVIVSGLPRTLETARRVLAELLTDKTETIAIESWPQFEELRGGRLSLIADADLDAAFNGAFYGVVAEEKKFLGGESIGQLFDRVLPALALLRADTTWDTVLLVLHGGVNRAILSYALTGQRLFLGNLAQTAGCINALDVGLDEHDWVLRFANFAAPAPLQMAARSTTMEQLLEQYKKSRSAKKT